MESHSPSKRVSVVLPIYNTGEYLTELHRRLKATLDVSNPDYELIMVEDGGRDNAWEKLAEIAAIDKSVKAIKLSRNFGQHPAIAAGFERCSGEIIVLMDADLQDRPEDIPLLIKQLSGDVDIVYSTKQQLVEPLTTRLTSRLYHYTFSRLTRTQVPENIGTFRVFTRRFLDAILSYPERNILFGPLMFHAGFKSATVQVAHDERKSGKSGYTFRKRLKLAVDSLLSYTDLPHRLLMNTGLFILFCCALYIIALFVRYVAVSAPPPPGLTLLALLITISTGVTMFSFGILGTYVFRVYHEVLSRPRYIIARSMNLDSSNRKPLDEQNSGGS